MLLDRIRQTTHLSVDVSCSEASRLHRVPQEDLERVTEPEVRLLLLSCHCY